MFGGEDPLGAQELPTKDTQPQNRAGSVHAREWLLLLAVAAVVCALSLGHALRHHDHNEQMYVAAASLIADGFVPYRDFAFVQMPYQPVVYAAMLRMIPSADPVLVARLCNWAAWLAGAVLIYRIGICVGYDPSLATGFGLLYALNPFMLRILFEASNYVMPATLAIAQSLLLLRMTSESKGSRRAGHLVAVGVLGGLAVGMKLYFIATILPCMILACFVRNQRLSFADGALAGVGFCIALLPAAVLAAFYPQQFVFNNLLFHGMTTQAYREIDFGLPVTMMGKISFVRNGVLRSVSAVITLLLIAWGNFIAMSDRRWWRSPLMPHLLAELCAAAIGIAVAVAMTPTWPQYLALGMPSLVIAAMLASSRVPASLVPTRAFLVGAGACMVFAAFFHPRDAAAFIDPSNRWKPLVMRRQAIEIAEIAAESGVHGKLATLRPLYAVQGNLPFYLEFAAGPFVYAVADRLDPEVQKTMVAVGPSGLAALLDADPPAAILAGVYHNELIFSDQVLASYAESHGYRKVPTSLPAPAAMYIRVDDMP